MLRQFVFKVILMLALAATLCTVRAADPRVNIAYDVDSAGRWKWMAPGDTHVAASQDLTGPQGRLALHFANSRYDETSCNLVYSYESQIAYSDRFIPNNGIVRIGAWVKVSDDFQPTQPDSGIEVRLRLHSPYGNQEYWSNSAGKTANSLVFGWNLAGGIPWSRLKNTWQYFEIPVRVGDSGWAAGWTDLHINVSSRVAHRGDFAAGFKGTVSLAGFTLRTAAPLPAITASNNDLTLGGDALSLRLSAARNYALAQVATHGSVWNSGGLFPTFTAYDAAGNGRIFRPDDSEWKTSISQNGDSTEILYARAGLKVAVTYQVAGDAATIRVRPIEESLYRLCTLQDGGTFLTSSRPESFLLVPYLGGELITLSNVTHEQAALRMQDWQYSSTFVSVGDQNTGLILRAPGFGAQWTYGTRTIGDQLALSCGLTSYFRPGARTAAKAPLVEPEIALQLRAVSDVNHDGSFDWVDLGVAYRQAYIRPNATRDPLLAQGFVGKIDVSLPVTPTLDYATLLNRIQQLQAYPQTWWIVGAHTSKDKSYCDPPYAAGADPNWRGDYMAFRSAAAKFNARIGLHEMPHQIREDMPDWPVPVRLRSDGKPVYREWASFERSLGDPTLGAFLDRHFASWKVGRGDTWHFDVVTAEPAAEDYNPANWATRSRDYHQRIAMLKHVQNLGIHITSEGLQEGMHEYCDFSWHAITAGGDEGEWTGAQSVPLTPVLYLGQAYYAMAHSIPRTLLYGARYVYEGADLPVDELIRSYKNQIQPWTQIAHRVVTDVDKTPTGWIMRYDPPATLTVDLVHQTFDLNCETK